MVYWLMSYRTKIFGALGQSDTDQQKKRVIKGPGRALTLDLQLIVGAFHILEMWELRSHGILSDELPDQDFRSD
jgi:hypothetical protein